MVANHPPPTKSTRGFPSTNSVRSNDSTTASSIAASAAATGTLPKQSQQVRETGTMVNKKSQHRELEVCDLLELRNPQSVAEYAPAILRQLLVEEEKSMVPYDYLKRQPEVSEKMRAILVEWLVEVHYKFKMLPETLYITVNIIDRFLEKTVVTRKELQVIGIAALLIASKYEEIYPPQIKDYIRVTDKTLTREEILAMEYRMLV